VPIAHRRRGAAINETNIGAHGFPASHPKRSMSRRTTGGLQ
jgi:hypothetical protein